MITEMTTRHIDEVNEDCVSAEFDCGLKCFLIPKKTSSAYAVLAVNFGANDTEFSTPDGGTFTLPNGTAHFLEHKMFDTREGDAFEKYAVYGGDANAYTASDRTCYVFSATENFRENLCILLDHVSNAYITPASVKKEKGIIAQEIKMYNDKPRWRLRYDMMKCLYGDSSVACDPAGTVSSVKSITPEILAEGRRLAYYPGNTVLCVCGDVSMDDISCAVGKAFKIAPVPEGFSRIDRVPEPGIASAYSETRMDVFRPLFCVGLKFPAPSETDGMREFAAVELLFDLMFGKSSSFYTECYDSGIFDEISDSYQTSRKAFFAEISGVAGDPQAIFAKIKERIAFFRENGVPEADFERAKKALYADTICDYDSAEDVADNFVSFYFEGDDMFGYPAAVKSLTTDYLREILTRLFDDTTPYMSLSVILPLKGN